MARQALGNLRVEHAHGPDFDNDRYINTEPKSYTPPEQMLAPHTLDKNKPQEEFQDELSRQRDILPEDKPMDAAVASDLKKRNIRTKRTKK